MKTKLEMAHEYAIALINSDCEMQFDKFIQLCWNYADAMQAEADKREKKTSCDTNVNFDMYLEYDASINYPPDARVMYKGEKRLAVSINAEKEWQPDWSQAPDNAMYWAMDGCGQCNWYKREPDVCGSQWDFGGVIEQTDTGYDYQGNWRESLRKRPK